MLIDNLSFVTEVAATVMATIFLPIVVSFVLVYLNEKLVASKPWRNLATITWMGLGFLTAGGMIVMMLGASVVAARYAVQVPFIGQSGWHIIFIGLGFGFFQWMLAIVIAFVREYRAGWLDEFLASLQRQK